MAIDIRLLEAPFKLEISNVSIWIYAYNTFIEWPDIFILFKKRFPALSWQPL